MAKVSDVAAYICKKYPHKHELSKARLTKLVYLADWKSVQIQGAQLTNIEWYFHNYGPYVDDVANAAIHDDRFDVIKTSTMYGDSKTLYSIKQGVDSEHALSSSDKHIIDTVIEETKTLYWDSFIKHVYDTYPIRITDRHEVLDLIELANNEKAISSQSKKIIS